MNDWQKEKMKFFLEHLFSILFLIKRGKKLILKIILFNYNHQFLNSLITAANGDEGVVTLYIGNFKKDTTEEALLKFFKKREIGIQEIRKLPKRR